MMTAAGTVTLLIDTYLSIMTIIKTGIRETLTKRVTQGKDPILPLVMVKIIVIGITTSKTADITVIERNTENWMITGVEITGQIWKEV